ncbi:hypothetical protein RAB80_005581 [Fusarium oxysporum f. sp. vasinfectum]|nr:hypothetical protein RAB80_005581 [Fusarium oxysporum f. sp. vasinfectum]KAK2939772.1 hypothetical protein FoTM2_002992 [Fusarium oxysporum f. sp. vasinfectum]
MSKTSTSTAASQTACADIYNTPNQDNVCAMFRKDNHTDIMQACCGEAKIISYSGDCGLYCVALDQTIDQLSKCLYDHGAPDEKGVWCSGNAKTTKTKDANIPRYCTSHPSSSKSSETSNAAANTSPQFVTTTLGLTIGALVLSSMAIGGF